MRGGPLCQDHSTRVLSCSVLPLRLQPERRGRRRPCSASCRPARHEGACHCTSRYSPRFALVLSHRGEVTCLHIERLYVWYKLCWDSPKEKAKAPAFYLRLPKRWVVPTSLKQFFLEDFSSTTPRTLPDRSPFTLIFSTNGILVYLRHSYLELSAPFISCLLFLRHQRPIRL